MTIHLTESILKAYVIKKYLSEKSQDVKQSIVCLYLYIQTYIKRHKYACMLRHTQNILEEHCQN